MLTIVSEEPNSVCTKQILISTSKGVLTLGEGEPISYRLNHDRYFYLGSSGTVLRVAHKTSFQDLAKVIKPATFSLVVEDDGEITLKATIEEHNGSYETSMTRKQFTKVADIISVRGQEGVLL